MSVLSFTCSPNPIIVAGGVSYGTTTISWTVTPGDTHVYSCYVNGVLFAQGVGNQSATTGNWVTDGTTFHLDDFIGEPAGYVIVHLQSIGSPLPTLSTGNIAICPVVQSQSLDTGIAQFITGQEQRWQRRGPIGLYDLKYTNISATDKATLNSFIASRSASADHSWSFGFINGYSSFNCMFDDDSFSWTENYDYPGMWNGEIKFRESSPRPRITGNTPNGTAFPVFGPGLGTGYPYVESTFYKTKKSIGPSGNPITYAMYGAGLGGFPQRALKGWNFSMTSMAPSDVATLMGHYLWAAGRYHTFQFFDPEAQKIYPSTRYDMDQLDLTYEQNTMISTNIKLVEVWDPNNYAF